MSVRTSKKGYFMELHLASLKKQKLVDWYRNGNSTNGAVPIIDEFALLLLFTFYICSGLFF